jgi:hypothetical protein
MIQLIEDKLGLRASVSAFHKLDKSSGHSGLFIGSLFEEDLISLRNEIDRQLLSLKRRDAIIAQEFEDLDDDDDLV